MLERLRKLEQNRFSGGMVAWNKAQVTAPDGTRYVIYLAQGYKTPAYVAITLWAAPVAALLAWLFLALWIALDARERRLQAAGWGKLGLLAGPLALAVWLIYRRNNRSEPVCAACGKELVEGALYCADCGHPVRPGCPACHRPVQMDWHHCIACGTDLTEG